MHYEPTNVRLRLSAQTPWQQASLGPFTRASSYTCTLGNRSGLTLQGRFEPAASSLVALVVGRSESLGADAFPWQDEAAHVRTLDLFARTSSMLNFLHHSSGH